MAKKKVSSKKEKKKNEKKEVCEIFEVEKKGKTSLKKSCGNVEEEKASPKIAKEQNKTLLYVLITLITIIVLFVAIYYYIGSLKVFNYNGIQFREIQEGDLTFYKTTIPVIYQNQLSQYAFYLRGDPRKNLIEFKGNLTVKEFMVFEVDENLDCEGDGIIAVSNMVNLYEILGADVVKDEVAWCDLDGRYMFVRVLEGYESKIINNGPGCYDLIVNNCEVLPVTEKFMLEGLKWANQVAVKE